MLRIYCVPGLGNDRRIFDNLAPRLLSQDIHFLEHLRPQHWHESLEHYAKRLSQTITDHPENSVIIGMSLGGMITVELAKLMPFKRVFLISTIKKSHEAPWQFYSLRQLPFKLHIPVWLLRWGSKPVTWLLDTTDEKGRKHIKEMVDDLDKDHLVWGQHAAVHWQNDRTTPNVIHIHGTEDEIFPHENIYNPHTIEGGNHYMIMDRAEEIARIINNELMKIM